MRKLILPKAKTSSWYRQPTTPHALWRRQGQIRYAKYFQNKSSHNNLQKYRCWLWSVHKSKLTLELPIIRAIVSNGVLSIFINVLLIYLQIIIQFCWPNFKRKFKLTQGFLKHTWQKRCSQNKITTHILKRREKLAQLDFIRKLPENTMKGVTGYKSLSLLQGKPMRPLHQCHRERF